MQSVRVQRMLNLRAVPVSDGSGVYYRLGVPVGWQRVFSDGSVVDFADF